MRAVLAAVAGLTLAASAQAAVLFSFEGSTEGFAVDQTKTVLAVLGNSTTGATLGSQSMSLQAGGGLGQLSVDLSTAQWASIATDKKISVDITVPTVADGSWGGWWGYFTLIVNSQNGNWQQGTSIDLSSPTQYGTQVFPGTRTLTWDFTGVTIPADPGGWKQIFIQHNWGNENLVGGGTGPSTLYIDNIQTIPVPEPTALGLLGLAAVGLVRRRSK